MRETLLDEFKQIVAKGVVSDSNNCIYNRAAFSFALRNNKDINKDLAISFIKELLNVKNGGIIHNGYKMLTLCKITLLLLDRFICNPGFVTTYINKLMQAYDEVTNLDQTKKMINSRKVWLNICIDCRKKVIELFSNREILDLAHKLPTT